MTLARLCEHDHFRSHPTLDGKALSWASANELAPTHDIVDCPGGTVLDPEQTIIIEGPFIVPAAEGQNEEPYELGWCAVHHDVARRWPDGSWNCWWESLITAEASKDHHPANFRPLADALAAAQPGSIHDDQ